MLIHLITGNKERLAKAHGKVLGVWTPSLNKESSSQVFHWSQNYLILTWKLNILGILVQTEKLSLDLRRNNLSYNKNVHRCFWSLQWTEGPDGRRLHLLVSSQIKQPTNSQTSTFLPFVAVNLEGFTSVKCFLNPYKDTFSLPSEVQHKL